MIVGQSMRFFKILLFTQRLSLALIVSFFCKRKELSNVFILRKLNWNILGASLQNSILKAVKFIFWHRNAESSLPVSWKQMFTSRITARAFIQFFLKWKQLSNRKLKWIWCQRNNFYLKSSFFIIRQIEISEKNP